MKDFIKAILGTIKRIPLFISCVIPKDNKLYIFGSWFGEKYADNSKAIFEYALKHSNKRCVWITKSELVYENLQKQGYPVLMQNSLKGIWIQMRAKVCFSCTGDGDFNRFLLGNCYHVELWHGVGGGKKCGYDDKITHKEFTTPKNLYYKQIERFPLRHSYMLATSDLMKKQHKSAFRVPDNHFIYAGQPRNDMFFDPNYQMKTIDKSFLKGKRFILYMPTHRNEGNKPMQMKNILNLQALNDFCENNDIYFVIKKHFYHRNEVESLGAYPYIVDVTGENYDPNEIMMLADYLISDYSSCMTDFLLFDRPAFLFCYDLDEYLSEDRDLYYDIYDIAPSEIATTFDDLISQFHKVIECGEDCDKERRNKVRRMFYADDSVNIASGKILDQVEKIIKK